ncbi:MAG: glycosyltransferase family 87 protein [Candidatus Dormibacteria bacterium]
MNAVRRGTLLSAVLGLAVVLAYLLLWLEISPAQIGRTDFTNTYVGATLVRHGLAASMYSSALQASLYARVITPHHAGYLPFDAAPLAAVVTAPLSLLTLDAAYRIWSLLQFVLIAAAAVVAVRAAPSGDAIGRGQRMSFGLIALACVGTSSTLLQGQWDGVSALGLAISYACLRSRRMGWAGAVLAVSSLLAKPHLALGLAAFALGWRDRRLILGALAGGAAMVAVSVLAVGTGGVVGFVGSLGNQVTAWSVVPMVSLISIAGSVLGQTRTADLVAAAGSVVAMVLGAVLGSAVRMRPHRLEAALAGATVLSVLASPHAYGHDLALLVPAAAWSLTALAAAGGSVRSLRRAVLVTWVAINVADYLGATNAAPALVNLTPWTLVAAAGLAIVVCLRPGEPAPPEAAAPSATEQSAGSDVVVRPLSALPG